MLKFYKKKSTSFTEKVEWQLEEMVVAHQIIAVEGSTELPSDIDKAKLPVLTDGYQSWSSETEIEQFLEKLQQDLTLSYHMQSDSCHIDPENPDQCL